MAMAMRGIHVLGGIVDSDYRGTIRVLLINLTNVPCTLVGGHRIAQMICTPFHRMNLTEQKELPTTARGAQGFGSTDTARQDNNKTLDTNHGYWDYQCNNNRQEDP